MRRKDWAKILIAYKMQGCMNLIIIHLDDEDSSELSTSKDTSNGTYVMGMI
jgi:hypothetical protein